MTTEHEAGRLTIAAGGHESATDLTPEQVAFLDLLITEGVTDPSRDLLITAVRPAETRADASRWAVETLRQDWIDEGQGDGPGE